MATAPFGRQIFYLAPDATLMSVSVSIAHGRPDVGSTFIVRL
jgi:hypothetical protein